MYFTYIGRRVEINKPLDTRIYQHVSAWAVFKDIFLAKEQIQIFELSVSDLEKMDV